MFRLVNKRKTKVDSSINGTGHPLYSGNENAQPTTQDDRYQFNEIFFNTDTLNKIMLETEDTTDDTSDRFSVQRNLFQREHA